MSNRKTVLIRKPCAKRELMPCTRCGIRLTSFEVCTQCWCEDQKEAKRKAERDRKELENDIIDALYTG